MENLAACRRLLLEQIDALAFGIGFEAGGGAGPVGADGFGDGDTVLRVEEGGLEEVAPGEFAEAVVEFGPSVDCAGDVTESMPASMAEPPRSRMRAPACEACT